MKKNKSITRGTSAALPSFDYAEFLKRLRYHNLGDGTDQHLTANPLFVVKEKVFDWGYDLDFTNKIAVINAVTDHISYSLEQFAQDLTVEQRETLDSLTENEVPFLQQSTNNQIDILQNSHRYKVTGYTERLEFVNCHFTREAAQQFIDLKRHNYGPLTIAVTSQKDCAEFNSIIYAMLNNRIA
ncbi:hypothetical protein AD45P2_00445 [Alteromonas phage vB_AmaP_AD45-P2]|uniref:Uncharacterized protein n=1 Tax=Pseudorhizobium pelagicum TaxID=1509405 RepID=A0A922NX57_9HYPH|nr:hypothetical protein M610_gp093 [Alteromonas phage vB_AmaP_AD45-P1]AGM47022.1 hypothetical protein AD45P3_00420 [Alteromonas phage vB_AmaP_AD45-P3]AGM47138.1 hypothetical protein AD45P4_00415 [Alteromonas phage vB_AmaP_AD45-P4]AGM47260.1 hypothetical protein AD45P2_00445 [Alteromonas phage vB_AmaP_AD45-P2]KEQ05620.1 hypothetical protein GV68_08815 [Pseudorhizobium pelagicum]AGM46906.1 hypothetical protein AD45P1_00440 [Alteromonas phage vB_AmaP_AD45-P1]